MSELYLSILRRVLTVFSKKLYSRDFYKSIMPPICLHYVHSSLLHYNSCNSSTTQKIITTGLGATLGPNYYLPLSCYQHSLLESKQLIMKSSQNTLEGHAKVSIQQPLQLYVSVLQIRPNYPSTTVNTGATTMKVTDAGECRLGSNYRRWLKQFRKRLVT